MKDRGEVVRLERMANGSECGNHHGTDCIADFVLLTRTMMGWMNSGVTMVVIVMMMVVIVMMKVMTVMGGQDESVCGGCAQGS